MLSPPPVPPVDAGPGVPTVYPGPVIVVLFPLPPNDPGNVLLFWSAPAAPAPPPPAPLYIGPWFQPLLPPLYP